MRLLQLVLLNLTAFSSVIAVAQANDMSGPDWSGYVSLEPRVFADGPLFSEQPNAGLSTSVVLAPQLSISWNDGNDRVTIAPFLRWDAQDDERTHADLREALWQGVRGPWTWQVGVGRVFWGVTESRHLVDIINQTDWVGDIDEEDKLGQPMIALERWTTRAGSFSVFVLPGSRERTFPAADARLRGPLPINTDQADYESSADEHRIDWALRWSHTIGAVDVGMSGFYGTAREPRLLPTLSTQGQAVLIPRYDVIGQVGIDLQYTRDVWLWKLEAIRRNGHGKAFTGVVAGLEYTLYGFSGGSADLGLLLEYLYDGRDVTAPPTLYDDNGFAGFRLGLNDAQGTAILGGAIVGDSGTLAILEAERRLGDTWKVEVEARWFVNVDATDPILGAFRNDSVVTLRVARYL